MFVNPFTAEAWTEYALGICILFIRIFCRIRLIGFKWDGDDYFAILAIFFWTAELSMLQIIGQNGTITGMNDELALKLSDQEKSKIIIGSKCLLAGWCIYVTMIWILKACMLFLYGRLTLDLKQRKMVKITAVICVLAYISTIVVILAHCTPIHKKWQVYPYPGDACALNTPNYYALVVTNVLTDGLITVIPIPLLWKVQMPLRKKLLCGMWLCTGIFIMIATLLRCILCLQDVDNINVGTIWSIRETFIGIIAVNIPVVGPWLARNARRAGSNLSGSGSKSTNKNGSGARFQPPAHRLSRMDARVKDNRNRRGLGWTTIDDGSDEHIVKDEEHELQSRSQSQSNLSGRTTSGTAVAMV